MKKVQIEVVFEQYIAELVIKGRNADTIRYYKENVLPFLLFAKIKYASQLNITLVKKYIIELRGKYSNPVTINTHLRAVRAFCYYCGKNNYTVPFLINLVSEPKNIKVPYDGDTIRELVLNRDLTKPAIAILMLISTAVRAKTLCNMHVEDIDMYSQTIYLRELKNNTQSVLPLPQYVCKRLKRYIKEYNLMPKDYLFSTKFKQPYNRHSLYLMVTRYLKQKGYDSKGVHRFRHTFSKMTAEEGISSILLSRWLTHSDIKQSEQYVNLYGNDLRSSLKYTPVETILSKEKDGLK